MMSRKDARKAEVPQVVDRPQHNEHVAGLDGLSVTGWQPFEYPRTGPVPAKVIVGLWTVLTSLDLKLSPAEARDLAASLIRCADFAEGVSVPTPAPADDRGDMMRAEVTNG